jgi:hypothetical protein
MELEWISTKIYYYYSILFKQITTRSAATTIAKTSDCHEYGK